MINNYKELQALFLKFISVNELTPGGAPHGVFWEELDYKAFVTGEVPNLGIPILQKGSSENSNIVKILKGELNYKQQQFPQMPRPNPPYNANSPSQTNLIKELSDWIDAGCPN